MLVPYRFSVFSAVKVSLGLVLQVGAGASETKC